MYMYIIIIIIIIITSGEYEGLNCLCSSIMTLRQTRTFSSFSTCMETEIQLTTSTCTRIYRVHIIPGERQVGLRQLMGVARNRTQTQALQTSEETGINSCSRCIDTYM